MYTFLSLLISWMFIFQIYIAIVIFMYRMPRRSKFILRFTGSLVVCCLASTWWDYSHFSTYWGVALIALQYIFIFALIFICVKFSWKCDWSEAVFYGSAAYAMQHISYIVTEMVFIVMWDYCYDFTLTHYYLVKFLNDILSMALVYSVVYFLLVRRLHKDPEHISVHGLVIPSLFQVLVTSTLNLYLLSGLSTDIFTKLYPLSLGCMTLFFYNSLYSNSKSISENARLEQMLAKQSEYAKMSKDNIELINMKCHDLKHQISLLSELKDSDERQTYLKDLQHEVMIYENIAKTGCDPLDIILTDKCFYCGANGIKLTYIVDKNCLDSFSADDIYSLFGNAIDNAIECVSALSDPEKKVISFRAELKGSLVCIRFDNFYEGEISFKGGLPVSKKEDKRFHGFGLKSIRYLAEKHGGSISISTENHTFSLTIIIPVNYDNNSDKN